MTSLRTSAWEATEDQAYLGYVKKFNPNGINDSRIASVAYYKRKPHVVCSFEACR